MSSKLVEAKRLLIGTGGTAADWASSDLAASSNGPRRCLWFGGLSKPLMNRLLINIHNAGWKKGPHRHPEHRQGIPEAKVFQGTNTPSLLQGP